MVSATVKQLFLVFASVLLAFPADASTSVDEPDSAYVFAYAPDEQRGRGTLRFAWSVDRQEWHAIGPEHGFLYSDYGTWGGEKKLYDPFLFRDRDGLWHAVWSLNDRDGAFAHAASIDLIEWQRQSYPIVSSGANVLMPEVAYDSEHGRYVVSWMSDDGGDQTFHSVRTRDFKTYGPTEAMPEARRLDVRRRVRVGDELRTGTVHRVAWTLVDGLIQAQKVAAYETRLHRETTDQDAVRFASLEPLEATITVDGDAAKPISEMLMGVFFEDINYAADGGIYAELVQNRGFEYRLSDKKGRDPDWNSLKAWHLAGSGATVRVDTVGPLHPNNPHYAVLDVEEPGAGLANEGFDGIAVQAGDTYDFSVFARILDGGEIDLLVRLVGPEGGVHGTARVTAASQEWQQLEAVIAAEATVPNARLEIVPQAPGRIALDMISLFPQKTFMGRENGLRADLAQVLADLKPRFVRFPGGCVAHGDGLGNIYHWKNTIGPLEARKPQRNLWGYHQSMGLGYYEYFQFSEDIGAEPVPVVAAGVPCQNSSAGGAGQQGGIPMCEMGDYVQDVLDLIEWANGAPSTEWGSKRAAAGHPEPFDLKYVGIGNEDLITDVFEARYRQIVEAVREQHPEITVIGTVGPFSSGTDYREGWELATDLGLEMVDEHYYQPPGWFIHNQDYYDRYDRSKSKVYLGEYAAHLPGRPNNIETALAEAIYLTALERNADVVHMASYAPLLAKDGFTQWRPDLIYFDNTQVKPTVGYYVQKLYGQNAGDTYIASRTSLSDDREDVRKRVAASVVHDSASGDVILKMVNMLPVDVQAAVDLTSAGVAESSATRTVLTGHPDDEDARPVTDEIAVAAQFDSTLPAYSFTLIRMKGGPQ